MVKIYPHNDLTDPDFWQENTFYVVAHDYDFGGATVTMPANVAIGFIGGLWSNGVIAGNDTRLFALLNYNSQLAAIGARQFLNTSLTLSGTWLYKQFYPQYFGAVGDGVTDDTAAIKKAAAVGSISLISDKYSYKVSSEIALKSNTIVDCANAPIIMTPDPYAVNVLVLSGVHDTTVKNVKISSQRIYPQLGDALGFSSGVRGINIHSSIENSSYNNIIQNVYGEGLHSVIKVDSGGGEHDNISFSNITSYDCVQPIYAGHIKNSSFDGLDLDQAIDVDKLNHTIYISGYTLNITFNNVTLRRGSLDPYCGAFHLASSDAGIIENVIITNVVFDNINNYDCFKFANAKNINVSNLIINLSGGTHNIVGMFAVDDISISDFTINGDVRCILDEQTLFAGYNNMLTLSNGVVNATFIKQMFGSNCIVSGCTFNVILLDGGYIFRTTLDGVNASIGTSAFNISRIDNANTLPIRIGGEGTLVFDGNTFDNNSGTLHFCLLADFTDEGGGSSIAFSNNGHRGFTTILYSLVDNHNTVLTDNYEIV